MKRIVALKPLPIGGKWYAEGEEIPLREGVDVEKLTRKGFVEVQGEDDETEAAQSSGGEQDAELASLRQQLEQAQRAHQVVEGERDVARQRQEQADAELDKRQLRITELENQLAESTSVVRLPADARDRLVAVKGVSDKLADAILDTLQAPAAPAGE